MIELPICHLGSSIDPNWNTTVKVIEPHDDIPIPLNLEDFYLDFETTSEDPERSSVNPHAEYMLDDSMDLHRACKILGVAFLFDNEKSPYYIPVRHYYLDEDDDVQYRFDKFENVKPQKVYIWLDKVFHLAKKWFNHNIKYDYHVLYNETGIVPTCKLICSIILSKIAAIKEKLNYGLTEMMAEFGIDITPYEQSIKLHLGRKYKDYGLIPPDNMAVYAGVDVLAVRFLRRKLKEITNSSTSRVEQLELDLLPTLIQMEQVGCKVDIPRLMRDWTRISDLQRHRVKRIKKYADFDDFDISKENSKYELFVEKLGWQLDYTSKTVENLERGIISEADATFSFGANSIRKHASKNPKLVASYLAYQDDEKLLTSYIIPYMERHVNSRGLIHCNVNQQLHTGRMSVTQPGMQTLPPKAKFYIIPYTDDYVLVEFDLSQIEFRVIAHYINNRAAIKAYQLDPATDFHKWIQAMCRLQERKPAKTCNFLLGYGGGKEHFIEVLAEYLLKKGITDPNVARITALETYKTYHTTLPELKPTSYRAANVVKDRGFIRTLLGRERHIDPRFAYKAFNSVCQGTAADVQKDITIRLQQYLSVDCLLHMLVHDSWLFSIRKDRVTELVPLIKHEIEQPLVDTNFQIPLLSDFGISEKNWKGCSDD